MSCSYWAWTFWFGASSKTSNDPDLYILHSVHICFLRWSLNFVLRAFVHLVLFHRPLHQQAWISPEKDQFQRNNFDYILTWPGPKPAKRPSECFGFLGLSVGPVAGGPEIEDCLELFWFQRFQIIDFESGDVTTPAGQTNTCWMPTSVLMVFGSFDLRVKFCLIWKMVKHQKTANWDKKRGFLPSRSTCSSTPLLCQQQVFSFLRGTKKGGGTKIGGGTKKGGDTKKEKPGLPPHLLNSFHSSTYSLDFY